MVRSNCILKNLNFNFRIIRPVEGTSIPILKIFSYMLPTTLPGIAVKNIMIKGVFWHQSIYNGIFILIGWIVACTATLLIIVMFKKSL
jgi:hypothetical protein